MSNSRAGFLHIALFIALCGATSPASSQRAPSTAAAGTQDIDRAVHPGDDFYHFANGAWLKSHALAAGQSRVDTTTLLREENARRTRELIEGASAQTSVHGNPAMRDLVKKVGDYYAAQMDVARIDSLGITPLAEDLAAIAAISNLETLSAYLGKNLRLDDGTNTQTDGIFAIWINQGFDQGDHYVPHVVQGGLGLPDRDDYLDAAPNKVELRNAYRAHIAAVLKLAGLTEAASRAANILDLEVALARTHASRADTDDVAKTNNPWKRVDFDEKAVGMNWAAYFKAAGLERQADFVVWQPSAVVGTSTLVVTQSIDTWKDYLEFHLIEHYVEVMPTAFADEHFAFASHSLGAAHAASRSQEAIDATNAALGEAIGRLYVQRYFSPEAKAAVVAMVKDLKSAFRPHIANAAWMSPATREKALAKLTALRIGVGYPDAWIDYSPLVIERGDALGNLRRAEAFSYRRAVAKLRRSFDPGDWAILPQTVSAVLNFSPNSMQFSAGLFQPPYFDPTGDAATNYGSAGAGMAHEISHSFDELGNLYDAQGRLVNWWTADDLARYHALVAPLMAQLDAYCALPGLCVKGKQVLGESTADLVGLSVAHDAYLLSLKGKPDSVKDGMTGEQRFFLAFGQRWRRVQTDAGLRQQVATDTHLPGEFRSDSVRNLDAWYGAYEIKPTDKLSLNPEKRVVVW
jgi:putative endopeptidase